MVRVDDMPGRQSLVAEQERSQRPVTTPAHASAPRSARSPVLEMMGEQLNDSPRVTAQRKLGESLNRRPLRPLALADTPVQRVFTHKTVVYSDGALPKTLPHKTGKGDAERLSRSARDFGTLTSTADFTAAVALLAPGEGNPLSPAEIAKAAALKPYMDLLPHLAGEEDGTEGKGGHLLTAMQAKWKTRLHITGDQEAAAAWEAEWNLLKDPDKAAEGTNLNFTTAKASTMFPAGWSEADLIAQLNASTEVRGGRELQPSGITVRKTGDTFYPSW